MNDIQLSKNFWLSELIKSDVAARYDIDNYPKDPKIIENLRVVANRILQPCRDKFGAIRPTSGYRNQIVNRLAGSKAENSQHIYGQAVDFEIPGVPNYKLAEWIKNNLIYDQLILECYTIGIPNSGWVHCSVKEGKNRMQCLTYSNKQYVDGLIQ